MPIVALGFAYVTDVLLARSAPARRFATGALLASIGALSLIALTEIHTRRFGGYWVAMEWVNGDSFSRALRISGTTEPVEPSIAARIIADACAGAHAAHELEDDDGKKLGVVHRDLSPHNILINADGFTKVCDFGVAKALGQLHEQTSAGQLKGKISYMSPEHCLLYTSPSPRD